MVRLDCIKGGNFVENSLFFHTHTHTHTHIYIYIYIYNFSLEYLVGWLVEWRGLVNGWLVGWSVGVGKTVNCWDGWLVCWSVGGLVGHLVSWLMLIHWLVTSKFSRYMSV